MLRLHHATICWALVGVMVLSPSMLYAQRPNLRAETTGEVDLSYVTPTTTFFAVAHPRRVLTAPELWLLPIEVASAAGKKELGIDPLDIEHIMLIVEPSAPGLPPRVGAVVRFIRAYHSDGILLPLAKRTVDAELDGKPYRRARGLMDFSIHMPDDRVLMVAHDDLLRRMLANKKRPAEGAMSRLLAEADTSHDFLAVLAVEPVRDLAAAALAELPVPPPLAAVKKLPDLVSSAEVRFNLTGNTESALTVRARDEATAMELEQLVDHLITMAKQMMAAEMAEEVASEDPVERAMAQYAKRVNGYMLEALRPTRRGDRLELSGAGKGQTQVAIISIVVAFWFLYYEAVGDYRAVRATAKIKAAKLRVEAFVTPLELYANDVGDYPSTAQGLEALLQLPTDLTDETKWNGPYVKKPLPLDPWGNPYQYEWPARNQEHFPDIWSFGPDGRDQSGDEIANWMVE